METEVSTRRLVAVGHDLAVDRVRWDGTPAGLQRIRDFGADVMTFKRTPTLGLLFEARSLVEVGDWISKDAEGGFVVIRSIEDLEAAHDDLLEFAWTIICNAGFGDWEKESADWQVAAHRFRERYHAWLDESGAGTPEKEAG